MTNQMVIIKNPYDESYDYAFYQEQRYIKFGMIQNENITEIAVINVFDIVCFFTNEHLFDNTFRLFYDDDNSLFVSIDLTYILIENNVVQELEKLFKNYLISQGIRVYG